MFKYIEKATISATICSLINSTNRKLKKIFQEHLFHIENKNNTCKIHKITNQILIRELFMKFYESNTRNTRITITSKRYIYCNKNI